MTQLGGRGGGGGESLLSVLLRVPRLSSAGARGDSHLDLLRGAGVRLRVQTEVGEAGRPGEGTSRLGVILTRGALTTYSSLSHPYQGPECEGLGMDLILSLLVAGDVDEVSAAGADHEQDGHDGEDHEDDESDLAQLYQESDILHVSWTGQSGVRCHYTKPHLGIGEARERTRRPGPRSCRPCSVAGYCPVRRKSLISGPGHP